MSWSSRARCSSFAIVCQGYDVTRRNNVDCLGDLTAEQIAGTGVKRISVGGALSRLALAAFMKGAKDMKAGNFQWVRDTMPTSELKKVFAT